MKTKDMWTKLVRAGLEQEFGDSDMTTEDILESAIESRKNRIDDLDDEQEELQKETERKLAEMDERKNEEREKISELEELKANLDASSKSLDAVVDAVVDKVEENRGAKVTDEMAEIRRAEEEMDVTRDEVLEAVWADGRLDDPDEWIETPESKPSVSAWKRQKQQNTDVTGVEA